MDAGTQKGTIDEEAIIRDFNETMQHGSLKERVLAIQKIDRSTGSILFPYLIKYYDDPDWQIRVNSAALAVSCGMRKPSLILKHWQGIGIGLYAAMPSAPLGRWARLAS
jgi:hypothetical protein